MIYQPVVLYLEPVVEHDLDEAVPEAVDDEAVLDLHDEGGGVDVRPDVVQEDAHEVGHPARGAIRCDLGLGLGIRVGTIKVLGNYRDRQKYGPRVP